jgi:hypothetical protein
MTLPPATTTFGGTPGVLADVEAAPDHAVAPVAASSPTTLRPPPWATSSTNSPPAGAGCVTGRRSGRVQPCAGAAGAGALAASIAATATTPAIAPRPACIGALIIQQRFAVVQLRG